MEKAMAPHSSTLAWKIPWTEEPGRLQSMRSLRVGHDRATSLSLFPFIHWIIEKAREFQKSIYFCFIDHAKSFDSVDHNKLWKIHKETGIPDHPTCLL